VAGLLAELALLASTGLGKYKGPLKPQALRVKANNKKVNRARIRAGLVSGRIGILAWHANTLCCQNSFSFKRIEMTESEFLDVSEAVFAKIEMALDDVEFDVDTLRAGNVLEIEFEDGSKVIVNRHAANQEIWLAARSGGYHYRFIEGQWINTRGDGEFFADVTTAISAHAGEAFSF
jgi:CyaY protein